MSINSNDISNKIDILSSNIDKINNQLDQINIPYISNFINNVLPNINNQLQDQEHTNILNIKWFCLVLRSVIKLLFIKE